MHATAIVTDALHIRGEHRYDTVDPRIEYAAPRCRARTFGISERVYADGNVDRRVESTEIDILARHLRDANVDPVAICLHGIDVVGLPTPLRGRSARGYGEGKRVSSS